MDHKILNDGSESRNNRRYASVVQDSVTQWIQSYPCKTKTSQETQRSWQKFLEPSRKPKVIYIDNSFEFGKVCKKTLTWNRCTSTPHRSETNGIAEGAVRRMKEQLRSCCNQVWTKIGGRIPWNVTATCEIFKISSDGKTPYERRFGEPFEGLFVPFGSLVEHHPISMKDQLRIHQYGKKVLPGIVHGYVLYPRGIWKGDILIVDLEELEEMDALEVHAQRLIAKVAQGMAQALLHVCMIH